MHYRHDATYAPVHFWTQAVFKQTQFAPAWIWLARVLVSGCGYSADSHRVEARSAREALEEVLNSWQQGESPEAWQTKKPPVVVQDMEWKNGTKLLSYEIVGEGEALDANLHCQVKLRLETPAKGKSEKTVKYLVGTSPVLTVFRSPEP